MQDVVRSYVTGSTDRFRIEVNVIGDRPGDFRRNMLMYPVFAEDWDVR